MDECEASLCHLHQFHRVHLITDCLSLSLYRIVVEFAPVFIVDIICGAFFKDQGWPQSGWRTSLTLLAQVGGDNVRVVYPHTRVTANGDLKDFLKKADS